MTSMIGEKRIVVKVCPDGTEKVIEFKDLTKNDSFYIVDVFFVKDEKGKMLFRATKNPEKNEEDIYQLEALGID